MDSGLWILFMAVFFLSVLSHHSKEEFSPADRRPPEVSTAGAVGDAGCVDGPVGRTVDALPVARAIKRRKPRDATRKKLLFTDRQRAAGWVESLSETCCETCCETG